MSGQVTRKQVNWDSASCQGLDTELFYDHQTGLKEKGLSFGHLRKICFSCPIQKDCLTIGVAHEQFGFWGGLSEEERNLVYSDSETKSLSKQEMKTMMQLKHDLLMMGISYWGLSTEVKKVERSFMSYTEWKQR